MFDSRRRKIPIFPILVVVVTMVSFLWVLQREELERNLKGWITTTIPLLAGILLTLWFFLSSLFSKKTRLFGLLALIVFISAFKLLLKVDGVIDGRGIPRLVWRWTSSQPNLIPPVTRAESASKLNSDPRLSQAADVNQFFGPDRNGIVPDIGLAKEWFKTPPKLLWKQHIGAGWSAYAVFYGRAYTQEQRGDEELVTCYELLTGKLLWAHADKAHFTQWQGGEGPRATPTIHKGRIYSYGATGILNCLDAISGKPIWQRQVLEENKIANIEWGICASPLIVDQQVIVTGGNTRGPILFSYHTENGVNVWKAGNDQASYASPILASLAGKRIILSNNARALTAHEPSSGTILLEHPWGVEKWPKASQPVVIPPDKVFLSAGYGMGCLLLEIKATPDGRLSATELWTSMKMKTQFNSPALLDGHLYGLDDGRLACLDLRNGERLWKEGRFASGQSLLAGHLIIIQSEEGSIHLSAAKPDGYQDLGKLDALKSKTWNHPTLAGRYLLVRNDREAACYELPRLESGY